MAKGTHNRPMKYGAADRRELIVQDSEVAVRCINDSTGSPVYLGRAKAGTVESDDKWQLRHITYDAAGGVLTVTWPESDNGSASTDYEFVWTAFTPIAITGITQAATAVVTVGSTASLTNGDQIIITGVVGMTQVNFTGSNVYTVAGKTPTTFQLSGINSTGYTAYSSGGSVNGADALNYTYS